MRKTILPTLAGILFLITAAAAGDIVYPWRAAKTIVKHGETFEILFRNPASTAVQSVVLIGPYNRVVLQIDSVSSGHFEFDSYTKAAVNNRIFVRVPEGTPEDLYNLVIKYGDEVSSSPKSVKVVKEFRKNHRFIHISDLHVSRQWVDAPDGGYAKELELLDRFVKVANIIAPDFVIVTGDNIHHYTRINADATGWGGTKLYEKTQYPGLETKWKNLFEGAAGLSGIHGFTAPVFALPGNHDYYDKDIKNDFKAMSKQWNDLCGLRTYGFRYGDTRILAMDDFMGDPIIDRPEKAPLSGLQGKVLQSFLDEKGHGKMRILAQHIDNRADTAFLDANRIHLLLHGHRHTPADEYIGRTPTLSTRPGTVCRSGVLDMENELGLFRMVHVNGDTFSITKPLRFLRNPKLPQDPTGIQLSLDYSKPNDGSSVRNTGSITNRMGVALPDCHIRFVLKKGKYKIDKGRIIQTFSSGSLTIVDVNVEAGDGAVTEVNVSAL